MEFQFRSYFPKYRIKNSEVYSKPLANPAGPTQDRFMLFIKQILKVAQEK